MITRLTGAISKMTNNTLPNSSILNIFSSYSKKDQETAKSLITEFLSSNKEGITVPSDFTINDLAIHTFGNKYPENYSRVRNFIRTVKKDLMLENKSLVETDLAVIYNEGIQLKEECSLVHISYRTGGVYLLTSKLLGLLLLAKNEEFQQFLRVKGYYVPHNLNQKYTRVGKYVAATKIPKKIEVKEIVELQ